MEDDDDGAAEGQLLSELSVAHSAAWELAQEVKQLRIQLHAKEVELAEQQAQQQTCRASMQGLIDTLQAERQELLSTLANMAADNLLREKERLELCKLHREHAALREELDAARCFLQQQECSVAEVQQALQAAKFSASDLQALHRHLQHAQEHWLPDMERLLHGCAMHETGAALQQEARQRQQTTSPRRHRYTTDSSTSTNEIGMYNEAERLLHRIAEATTAGAAHNQDPGMRHLENLRAQLLHMQHCLAPTTPGKNKGRNKGSSCCMAQPIAVINQLREQQQELLALAHHLAAQAEGAAARVSAQERSVTVLQQQVQDLSEASNHLLQEVPNLQSQLAASQAKLTEQQAATVALKTKAKQQLEAVVKQNKLLREQLTERHEALQAASQQLQGCSQQHQEVVAGLQQQLHQQQEQLQGKAKQQEVEVQQMRDQLAVSQAASQAALQRAKAAEHASRAVIAVLSKERQQHAAAADQHQKLLVEVQQEMRTQLQAVMEAYALELQALHEQLIQLESATPGTTVQSLLSPCMSAPPPPPPPPKSPSLQRLHDSLQQLQHGMGTVGDMEARVQLQAVQAQLQQAQRREAELLAENTQLCSVLGLYMQQPAAEPVAHDHSTTTAAAHVRAGSPSTPGKGIMVAMGGAAGGGSGRAGGGSPADGGRVADLIQTAGVVMNRLEALEDRARMLSNRLGGVSPTQAKQPLQSLPGQQPRQQTAITDAAPDQLASPHKPNDLWPPVSHLQQQGESATLASAAEMLPLQHEVAAMLAATQRYSAAGTANDLQAALLPAGSLSQQPPSEAEQCYDHQVDLNSDDGCVDSPEVELNSDDAWEDLAHADLISDDGCEDLSQADALTAAAEKEQELAQMLAQSRARYKKLKAKYSKQTSQQAALVQALHVQASTPQYAPPFHHDSRAQSSMSNDAHLDRRVQVSAPHCDNTAYHTSEGRASLPLSHTAAKLNGRVQTADTDQRALVVQAASMAQQQARQRASLMAVQTSNRPCSAAATREGHLVDSVSQQHARDTARGTTPAQPASAVTSRQVSKQGRTQQCHPAMPDGGAQASQLSQLPARRQGSHSSATSSSARLRSEQGHLQDEGSFAFAPSQMLRGSASRQDQQQHRRRQEHSAAVGSSHSAADGRSPQPDALPMPVQGRVPHTTQQQTCMQARAHQVTQQQRAAAPKQLPSRLTGRSFDDQLEQVADAVMVGRAQSAVPRQNSRQWQLLSDRRDGAGVGEEHGMGQDSEDEGEELGADGGLPVPAEVLNKAAQYAGDEGLARPSSAAPSSFRAAAAPAPPDVLSRAARYAGQEGQARPASAAPSVLRTQPLTDQQLHAQARPAAVTPSVMCPQPQTVQQLNPPARSGPPAGLTVAHAGHVPAEAEAVSDASSPDGRQQEYIDGWQRLQQRSSSGASSSVNTRGSILSGRSTNLSNLDSAYGGLEHPSGFQPERGHLMTRSSQDAAMQQAPLLLSEHEQTSATDGGASATDEGVSATDGGASATDEGVSATDGGASATDEEVSATDEEQQQQYAGTDEGVSNTDEEQQQQHAATDEVAEPDLDVGIQHEQALEAGEGRSHETDMEPEDAPVMYEEQTQAMHGLHGHQEDGEDEDGQVSDVTHEDQEQVCQAHEIWQVNAPDVDEDGMVVDVADEGTDAGSDQEPGSNHNLFAVQGLSSGMGETDVAAHQDPELAADKGENVGDHCVSDASHASSASAHAPSGVADAIPASLQTFLS